MAIPLRLGAVNVGGRSLRRSGLRWLCEDGHLCRPNEIVAFCDIALAGPGDVFPEESFDLQVAFAPRVAGRIRRAIGSPGGYLDRVPTTQWTPELVWAHLEPQPDDGDDRPEEPNLLFLAGRRFTDISEQRSGLLTGWHNRTRAWWGEGEGATLLATGTCEQDGLFRGEDGSFACMFDLLGGPAQVVMHHGEPLVPCAAILRQQLERAPADVAAMREDMAKSFLAGGRTPRAEGWLFMGALLTALEATPLNDQYDILTRAGVRRSPPAAAVCLSLAGESPQLLRHRKLGYLLNIHAYRLAGIGPALRDWLQRDFEPVRQGVDDVAGDYRRLAAAAPDQTFFVINRISSHVQETIQSYDAFDDSMMADLGSLRAQDLNLMLHDLSDVPNLQIVDADAIAADLGISRHLPDSMHASGELNREIRAELLRQVGARDFAGFAPRAVSRS